MSDEPDVGGNVRQSRKCWEAVKLQLRKPEISGNVPDMIADNKAVRLPVKPVPHFQNLRARSLWVQHELQLMHSSYSEIARENGWHRMTVAGAMYQPSDPQEAAIAKKIGARQADLFPERFDATGKRLHAVKSTAPSRSRNVKEEKVA